MSRVDSALREWEASAGGNRSHTEAVRASGRTSLADYPRETETSPDSELPTERPGADITRANKPIERHLHADPKREARLVTGRVSAVSLEQYRRLAAALHDAQIAQGLKAVMLTSARPGEGKTLTTVNLALTLSESYARRVLIIDADLRWPSVHSLLDVTNTHGLRDWLANGHHDPPFVEVTERLSVLTAGQPGEAALAGLSSPRMKSLLEECAGRFDWVLLDTPPVGVLPDAQLLARLTGAVILVVAAGETPAAVVARTIAELGEECVMGTVLNRVETHVISEADYYDRYKSTP